MPEVVTVRILYMEDDPALSRLLQKSLQRRGYHVDVAPNGEEGMVMLEGAKYSLLLCDYNMPFCGGLDVIRMLTEKGAFPPVIMITGEGNEQVAVEALKLGASDYIVKDVEMRYLELLPAVIEKVLYKQQLIRERQQMYVALEESEARYRRLVELSPDGIAVHVDGTFVFVNPAGTRLLGAKKAGELIGKSIFDVVHPDFREVVQERMALLRKQIDSVPWIEEKFLRLDGTTIDVEVSAVAFSHQGRPAVQVIFRDIAERKLVEERLHRMALFDPLTGLPNRTLFFDRMSLVLAFAKRNNYTIALLYLDLDRFKTINDTLGHDIGDLLLKEVAGRMLSCTRQSDTVARMGGDEFITICARVTAPQDAEVVAAKAIKVLSEPFHLQGQECIIGASIGISLFPTDGEDVETLLKRADSAMYRVKQTGKGGFAFYSSDQGGTPC